VRFQPELRQAGHRDALAARTAQGLGIATTTTASASFQNEIRTNLGLNVSYYRTWYKTSGHGQSLGHAGGLRFRLYDRAPVDARLPGGGGQQICGSTTFKRRSSAWWTTSSSSREVREADRGVQRLDITMNSRFGKGGTFQGGVNTGQTVTSLRPGGILPTATAWVAS